MNKKIVVPIGIVIIIIIVGVIVIYNQEFKNNEKIELGKFDTGNSEINEKLEQIVNSTNSTNFKPAPRTWQTSGPFQIDRTEYLLGEKVFLRMGGLDTNEKGQIAFIKQSNETHYKVYQTIPFDGSKKTEFNYYTDVKLSKVLGLCSIEDILGEWTVVFRGTDYQNLKFKVINQFIPGDENQFNAVC